MAGVLNPNLDNFRFEFSKSFYPIEEVQEFNDFLKTFNGIIKDMPTLIHESCQNINIPGYQIPEITITMPNAGPGGTKPGTATGPNTKSIDYISNVSWDEVISGKLVTLTCRNTIWNYVYFMIMFRKMFDPNKPKHITEFNFYATLLDAARIPVVRYEFRNCIIKSIPDITFNHGETLANSPTIDLGIRFNNLDYVFLLPGFNKRVTII